MGDKDKDDLVELAKLVAGLAYFCAAAAPPGRREAILSVREKVVEFVLKLDPDADKGASNG